MVSEPYIVATYYGHTYSSEVLKKSFFLDQESLFKIDTLRNISEKNSKLFSNTERNLRQTDIQGENVRNIKDTLLLCNSPVSEICIYSISTKTSFYLSSRLNKKFQRRYFCRIFFEKSFRTFHMPHTRQKCTLKKGILGHLSMY